jgi:hypothetical protein
MRHCFVGIALSFLTICFVGFAYSASPPSDTEARVTEFKSLTTGKRRVEYLHQLMQQPKETVTVTLQAIAAADPLVAFNPKNMNCMIHIPSTGVTHPNYPRELAPDGTSFKAPKKYEQMEHLGEIEATKFYPKAPGWENCSLDMFVGKVVGKNEYSYHCIVDLNDKREGESTGDVTLARYTMLKEQDLWPQQWSQPEPDQDK